MFTKADGHGGVLEFAEFNAAVEAALDAWSTNLYAGSAFLHDIGHTKRQEQRDKIRDELRREWIASGRPVYDTGFAPRFGQAAGYTLGGGRRLAGPA